MLIYLLNSIIIHLSYLFCTRPDGIGIRVRGERKGKRGAHRLALSLFVTHPVIGEEGSGKTNIDKVESFRINKLRNEVNLFRDSNLVK